MQYMLTEKGLNLLAKVNAGATLHLVKAKAGAGVSNTPYELTNVVEERQLIQISNTTFEDAKTIIQCMLSNLDVEIGYTLKQIGIFALDELTNEEILFIIGQDDVGDPIPSITQNEVENVYNIAIQTSNAPSVTIDFNKNDFIRRKDFEGALNTSITNFTEATTRANILAGDSLKVILGKIKRFFTDLKTVAYSGSYNDLGNKPTLGVATAKGVANNCTTTADGYVLDARQGKTLNDAINTQNSNFANSISGLNDSLNTKFNTLNDTKSPKAVDFAYEHASNVGFPGNSWRNNVLSFYLSVGYYLLYADIVCSKCTGIQIAINGVNANGSDMGGTNPTVRACNVCIPVYLGTAKTIGVNIWSPNDCHVDSLVLKATKLF